LLKTCLNLLLLLLLPALVLPDNLPGSTPPLPGTAAAAAAVGPLLPFKPILKLLLLLLISIANVDLAACVSASASDCRLLLQRCRVLIRASSSRAAWPDKSR
jgi:hypothetical protein